MNVFDDVSYCPDLPFVANRRFSNAEIGEQFGLTYSSVTRRVDVLKNRLENEDELKGLYEVLKSQIKV